MIKIVDLNMCELSYKNGTYGGHAGGKDGILYEGEEWMVKYPKNLSSMEGENDKYSTAPLSEYLGSHIYEILGYNVHQTMLGERHGKLVVACKDFETEGKRLLEIRTLKNHTGKALSDFLEEHISASSSDTHGVDIDELMIHLERNPVLMNVEGVMERFFEQAIIDILINNNDRNNGNWGIIREKNKKDKLAPIYDNGGSFSTKAPEDKMRRILESEELVNNSTNILTAYRKEMHALTARKFMMTFYDNPEFEKAIKKIIPSIKEKMPQIKHMMDEIPSNYISKDGTEYVVFSDIRREFYKSQLDIRMEYLLEPIYEKITEKHMENTKKSSRSRDKHEDRTI